MKIFVRNEEEVIWESENIKSVTIYNQNDEAENKIVVIDGFMSTVPDGYFVKSFNIGDFDRIYLKER